MLTELKKHPLHFVVLALLMFAHMIVFFMLPHLVAFRHLIVISAVFWYLVWATVHHYLLDDLNLNLILEYILIGGICVTLVWSLY